MNLGTLVTIAEAAPENLIHFVFENGTYEANGAHPIPGAGIVNLAGIAKAAGIPNVHEFSDPEALAGALPRILTTPGPTFVDLKVVPGGSYEYRWTWCTARSPGRSSATPCKRSWPRADARPPRRPGLAGRTSCTEPGMPDATPGHPRRRAVPAHRRLPVKRYDAIVVGGGHNGLTCAAYLARAGLRVLGMRAPPRRGRPVRGVRVLPRLPRVHHQLPRVAGAQGGGRPGAGAPRPEVHPPGPDPDVPVPRRPRVHRMARARTGHGADPPILARDVDGYAALFDFLNRFAERLGVSLFEAPPTLRALTSRLETPEDEEAFARVFLGSVADLLDEFLESGHLKSMLAMLGVMSNWTSPLSPGSATWLMMRPMSLASSSVAADHDPRRQVLRGSTGLPLGGMGSIVRAMRRSLEAAGGEVRTECEVGRILVTGGRAAGVVLADGEEIGAGAVVLEPRPVDDVPRPDRRALPGARVPRRGRAAAAPRLGVQGGAGARRHPRLRGRSQGPGAGPARDASSGSRPASSTRIGRSTTRSAAGRRGVRCSGAVPDHGGSPLGSARPAHSERQHLPCAGRAARRELGHRTRPVRRALHRRPRRVPAGVEGQDRRAEGSGARPIWRRSSACPAPTSRIST